MSRRKSKNNKLKKKKRKNMKKKKSNTKKRLRVKSNKRKRNMKMRNRKEVRGGRYFKSIYDYTQQPFKRLKLMEEY